jgi:hypothetical protein
MAQKLPELSEGWSWNVTRPTVPCTNPKCCGENSDGHPKVRIKLRLHNEVRRHGLIDVEFYGDNQAVIQRAQAMLDSVVQESVRWQIGRSSWPG